MCQVGGGQDWMNTFTATRGDEMALWPFAKLHWAHVAYCYSYVYCYYDCH